MITRANYEIWFLDFAEGKLDPSQQKVLFAFLENNPDLKGELEGFENISFEQPITKSETNNGLKKKQSWLLEKYSVDELIFNVCENNLNTEELREWNDLVKAMPELLQKVEAENKLVLKPLINETFDAKLVLKKNIAIYSVDATNYKEHFILYAETKELTLHTAISLFLKTNPSLKAEFDLTQKLILKPDISIVFENKNELKKREKVVAFYMWRSVAVAASIVLAIIFFYPGDNTGTKELADVKDTSKSIRKNNGVENNIIPNNFIEEELNKQTTNNVALNNAVIKNNKRRNDDKKEVKDEKITPNLPENKKEDKNLVEVPKNEKKEETPKSNVPLENEKPENNLANNTNNNKTEVNKDDKGLNPLNAVASVINKKYYEETTPKEETTSPFYAMKNVVKSASGGNAEINKKEDSEYKEFGFKIGEFKFSRKKNKNKADVD